MKKIKLLNYLQGAKRGCMIISIHASSASNYSHQRKTDLSENRFLEAHVRDSDDFVIATLTSVHVHPLAKKGLKSESKSEFVKIVNLLRESASPTAAVLDWNSSTATWAIVWISVVKVSVKEVISLIERVFFRKCISNKLLVALEERVLASVDAVLCDELALLDLPDISDELANASLAEFLASALLAVFVSLAF